MIVSRSRSSARPARVDTVVCAAWVRTAVSPRIWTTVPEVSPAEHLEIVVPDPRDPLPPVLLARGQEPVGGVEQEGGVLGEAAEVGLQIAAAEGRHQRVRGPPDVLLRAHADGAIADRSS